MPFTALVPIGSRTSEDKYGIVSGRRLIDALTQRGWEVRVVHAANGGELLQGMLSGGIDLVVPVGFGAPCEDGQVYAAARLAGLACAGPSPASGALMQDKDAFGCIVTATFAPEEGVRPPVGAAIRASMPTAERRSLIVGLSAPLVVKPAFGGSSEGLHVAASASEASGVVEAMLAEEGKVLVQQLETDIAAELSCTVLDGSDGPSFLEIVELRRDDVAVLGPEQKFGAEGLDRHIIPARLDGATRERVREAVRRLHRAVGAVGLTRTDVLVLRDGTLVVLEMNGIPGLLESSIACDAAAASGIAFDELAERYARTAFLPRDEPNQGPPAPLGVRGQPASVAGGPAEPMLATVG